MNLKSLHHFLAMRDNATDADDDDDDASCDVTSEADRMVATFPNDAAAAAAAMPPPFGFFGHTWFIS